MLLINVWYSIIMIGAINIALTGLESASRKLNASASNIANIQTVGSLEEGEQQPFNALTTSSEALTIDGLGAGVKTFVVPSDRPFVPAFDPDSPFANEEGLIGVPNVNLSEEAVNINLAEIQFKANIATIKTAIELEDELLRIFDKRV